MRKKDKKMWMFFLLGIAIIGIILYGGNEGWFQFNINIPNQTLAITPNQQATYSSCYQICSNQGFSKYYNFINSCKEGESKITYGYPNQQPILSCCCFENPIIPTHTCTDTDGDDRDTVGNVKYDGLTYVDRCLDVGQAVTEYICQNGIVTSKNWACDLGEICMQTRSGGHCIPAPHTWNPGDIVFSGSGSGSITGGTLPISNSIDLSDYGITTEGTCQLGARITTSWVYATGLPTCTGINGMEGLKWDFYDSAGLEYSRVDTIPSPPFMVDLHPAEHYLEWDGNTDWRGTVSKTLNLPACNIDYNYKIEIYIYSC